MRRTAADVGVEVVVPALAALLAVPPVKVLGDERPALGAVLLDEGEQRCVLRRRPEPLRQRRVQHLVPAVLTLLWLLP
jgi:hypothetical protein